MNTVAIQSIVSYLLLRQDQHVPQAGALLGLACVLIAQRAHREAQILLGLCVQLAGLMTVSIAGSVAVKLLGIARGAAIVLFEASFASADAQPGLAQLGGYGASVLGFLAYTKLRLGREGQPTAAHAPSTSTPQRKSARLATKTE